MTKREAFKYGVQRGYGAAYYCEAEEGESLEEAAYEAEMHSRDFSPFEFFASEANGARNPESIWDAYEAGVEEGIQRFMKEEGI